jgi:hypothetical protein
MRTTKQTKAFTSTISPRLLQIIETEFGRTYFYIPPDTMARIASCPSSAMERLHDTVRILQVCAEVLLEEMHDHTARRDAYDLMVGVLRNVCPDGPPGWRPSDYMRLS